MSDVFDLLYPLGGFIALGIAILVIKGWYDYTVNRNPFAFDMNVPKKKIIFLVPHEHSVDWIDELYDVLIAKGMAYVPKLRMTFTGLDTFSMAKKNIIFGYKLDAGSIAPVYMVNIPISAIMDEEYRSIYAKQIGEIEQRIDQAAKVAEAPKGEKETQPDYDKRILAGRERIRKDFGMPGILFYDFADYSVLLEHHKEISALDALKKENMTPESLQDKIKKNLSIISLLIGLVAVFVMVSFFATSTVKVAGENYAAPFTAINTLTSTLNSCQASLVQCASGVKVNGTSQSGIGGIINQSGIFG